MATHIESTDPHASAKPLAADDAISPMDVLIVLAEQKFIVLGVTAVCAILAIILAFTLPKRYTATATLLPPQQNSSMSSILASQLGNLGGMASLAGGGLGLKNPNEMFVAMLKSRTVEDAMVRRFGLMEQYHAKYHSQARTDFEDHTSVDGNGKDGLIHISIKDRDPQRAAELANGYIEQFRDLSEHLAITEASQRRLFFEKQLEQAKDNLADAEESMKEMEQKTGVIQLDSQARAQIASAASLQAQIVAKEVQIQSLRTFAASENAQLLQAQQELDTLRDELTKMGGASSGTDNSLIMLKGKVPEAGLEYVRKVRDVRYYETIFDILARQFEIAKLDEAKQGALIQVVDAAVAPDRASFPKRGMFLVGGIVIGLLAGIGTVLIRAGMQNLKSDSILSQKFAVLRRELSFRKRAV